MGRTPLLVLVSVVVRSFALPQDHANIVEQTNQKLLSRQSLRSVPCEQLSIFALRIVLKSLLATRSASNAKYPIYTSQAAMEEQWAQLPGVQPGDNPKSRLLKYAHCHEAAMWFLHHLSESEQQAFSKTDFLPLLPAHELPTAGQDPLTRFYASKVSCEECRAVVRKEPVESVMPVADVNQQLLKHETLRTVPCEQLSIFSLRVVLKALFKSHRRQEILYRYPYPASEEEMQSEWSRLPGVQPGDNAQSRPVKYGHCFEAVNWFLRYLSPEQQRIFAKGNFLPLLPTSELPTDSNDLFTAFYVSKVKCQTCHLHDASMEVQFV